MKKTELHLHLEGAAPPDFIRAIAAEKHTDLSGVFDERGHYAYDDFAGFLQVYEAATSVLKTPQDYARLLAEVLERSAEEGVIYTELFVSPEFCGGADLSAWRDYLAAMTEVADKMRGHGIESRGIVTAIRHFGPERARKSAICAAETAGDWITGFGMGGAEQVGKATDFAWSFDCAREAGLGLTCHAGEWGGPDSVREALALGCTRIGHGVRAIEDEALLRDLVDRDILLEICPGSNVALGLYPDWESHPIARLADAGLRFCVSTDDPPFFHTSMRNEYDRLASAFGWGDEVFRKINQWAVESAFCDNATQERLRKEFT
ncbi:adenosine deaminase [Paracoccus seriniphilus]|uniref:Adenosine deaminase n=1 Tax=Paracoccus seriniphilus TaxID=184748 RepID=A0A239PXJ2_9RHOB|nr:adenosine deaminase [Paracoccus seriniphilus]WCR13102.1 adenosine deaminase [Paracoccus seriniphilus]SNT74666.1 adenosine deaminase [Paracoccus seriniphilus]